MEEKKKRTPHPNSLANLRPANKERGAELGKKRRKRRDLNIAARRALAATLSDCLMIKGKAGKTAQLQIVEALIREAKKGNVKAFEVIRDTLGEKPLTMIDITTAAKEIIEVSFVDKSKEKIIDVDPIIIGETSAVVGEEDFEN